MIIETIVIIILNALVITGIDIASSGGRILEPVRRYVTKNFWGPISDPLFGCLYCMSSVRSIYTYLVLYYGGVTAINPIILLIIIPATAAVIKMIDVFIYND